MKNEQEMREWQVVVLDAGGGRTIVESPAHWNIDSEKITVREVRNPTIEEHCKTCKHWQEPDENWDSIVYPFHPGTFERVKDESEAAKVFGHRVRYCKHPKVEFYQRPQIDGACVVDGSEYRAELITGENFGCVLHEPL